MKKETIEFIESLFEFYQQSSSGREEENKKALNDAWDDIVRMKEGRSIVIECEGGIVQDVHGLPEGWIYDIADWDECENDGDQNNAERFTKMINDAKAQNGRSEIDEIEGIHGCIYDHEHGDGSKCEYHSV